VDDHFRLDHDPLRLKLPPPGNSIGFASATFARTSCLEPASAGSPANKSRSMQSDPQEPAKPLVSKASPKRSSFVFPLLFLLCWLAASLWMLTF
jgi:hypothetical protein